MPDWLSQPGEPAVFADSALRLLLAAIAGAAIGFEREKPERNAGLHTNMLVVLAALGRIEQIFFESRKDDD